MENEIREVKVSEEVDDGNDDVVTEEDAKSLEQEPESSTGEETIEEIKEEAVEAEPEVAEVEEPSKLEPKPVEGETPVEHARRKEIESLRSDKRDLLAKLAFKNVKSPKTEADISSLIEAGYTKEEIESSKKLISVLAPSMGFVNKSQTYQDKANEELDKFLDGHPEYLQKNDTEDVRFNKFLEIIKDDYNLGGKTPSQLKAIYSKVDRDVKEELGEIKVENVVNKIKAQEQKIKSISHTGGNKSITEKSKSKPVKEADGVKFIDFDDGDLE